MSPVTPPSSRVAHAPTPHATTPASAASTRPGSPVRTAAAASASGRPNHNENRPGCSSSGVPSPSSPQVREPLHDQQYRRARQAGEQDQDRRPARLRERGQRRELDQQQARHAGDRERAHVGIPEDLQAAFAVEAAQQCVAAIHEAVQVKAAGEGGEGRHQQGAGEERRQVQRPQPGVERGEHCAQQQADCREPGPGAREAGRRVAGRDRQDGQKAERGAAGGERAS